MLIPMAVTTTLAASAGGILAMLTVWIVNGKPDVSMSLNGALAGLVGITAACAVVGNASAIVIGGIWGTVAVGIFGDLDAIGSGLSRWEQIGVQSLGGVTVALWAGLLAFLLFTIVKKSIGIRVKESEEIAGLDIDEHGTEAYAGFQIFHNL